MRTLPVTRSLAALLLSAALSACGGEDGTGPENQVPTTVQISNATLSFDQPVQSVQLTVTVLDQDDATITDPTLTFATSDEAVASVDGSGMVTGLGNGTATITVTAGSATATAQVSVDLTPDALTDGVPVTGLEGPPRSQRFFTFEVPEGDADRILQFRMQGGTGDADLGIRFGERPDLETVDCASVGGPNVLDNLEMCAVRDPSPGTWHAIVLGYEDYTEVELDAQVLTSVELTSGTAATDLSADANDLLYFHVDVPVGAGLTLTLTGGTGDADMFATPVFPLALTEFGDLECVAGNEGNEESCTPDAPAEGTWTVVLLGYTAFDGVSLTAEVSGGT